MARRLSRHAAALGAAAPTAVMAVHVAVVAWWYSVGSFDDDAGYVLAARALAAGHGFTAHLANGTTVAGSAPPGYPLLLAPLAWVFPHTFVPMRALSAACAVAVVPLTWSWLRRVGVGEVVAGATCWLLALNPVLATFGSMVMAEAPFLVVLLGLLHARRTWALAAAAVALVWLKEAAIGIDAGLLAWLVLRRQWGKVAWVTAAVAASLTPVVAARALAGVPLAGSRYSSELGSYYQGGLVSRLVHVLPGNLHVLAASVLPASVVPRGAPLWTAGAGEELLKIVSWQVTIATVVGVVVWLRDRRDPMVVVAVALYLGEALLWPFENERRTVLVLPILLAWYAVGVVAIGRRARAALPSPPAIFPIVACTAVVIPLVAQFPRDYLFSIFQHTSQPQGSPYMRLLAALPRGVVETDYPSTTALFAGTPTAQTAFVANRSFTGETTDCRPTAADTADVEADRAAYLLVGDLNKANATGNPCMFTWAASSPRSVRLLRTPLDAASVFELIGPGTAHPDLADLTAGAKVDAAGTLPLDPQDPADVPGDAPYLTDPGAITYDWGTPATVRQVSLGGAQSTGGTTGAVTLQLREDGRWTTVATAPHGVGNTPGATPFLLVPGGGVTATAARVEVDGTGWLEVFDLHVLGTPG